MRNNMKFRMGTLLVAVLMLGVVIAPAVSAIENAAKQKQINPEIEEELNSLKDYLKEVTPDSQVPIIVLFDFGGQLNTTTFEERSKIFMKENGLYSYVLLDFS